MANLSASTCFFFILPSQSRPSLGIIPTIKSPKRADRKYYTYVTGRSNLVQQQSTKFRLVNASDSPNGPPPPNSSSWKQWLLGALIAVILPAIGHKGGLFSFLRGKLDKAVEVTEKVAETVTDVATAVEKIAETVEENLPDNSKLKKTIDSVEDVAKKVVEDAKITEQVIHEVKDVEEEIAKLDKLNPDEPRT